MKKCLYVAVVFVAAIWCVASISNSSALSKKARPVVWREQSATVKVGLTWADQENSAALLMLKIQSDQTHEYATFLPQGSPTNTPNPDGKMMDGCLTWNVSREPIPARQHEAGQNYEVKFKNGCSAAVPVTVTWVTR
jgi:hypothetical protein